MLILKYDVEVFTPPCDPGTERFSAMAQLAAEQSLDRLAREAAVAHRRAEPVGAAQQQPHVRLLDRAGKQFA